MIGQPQSHQGPQGSQGSHGLQGVQGVCIQGTKRSRRRIDVVSSVFPHALPLLDYLKAVILLPERGGGGGGVGARGGGGPGAGGNAGAAAGASAAAGAGVRDAASASVEAVGAVGALLLRASDSPAYRTLLTTTMVVPQYPLLLHPEVPI
jgi:hypothetical protein